MNTIDEYIARVKHLPPAPKVLPRLLGLLGQPNSDVSQVVDLIKYDPSLTVSVLKLCNSAFFASSRPADDIQEAITRLGFNQICRMVVAVTGFSTLFPPQKGYGYDVGELWKHSVASAVAAQTIAEDLGEESHVAFTAALLHDLGKIVLTEALESTYASIVEETEINQYSLLETEKKLLGVEHAEVGARLLSRWSFPENLVAAVCHHHQPDMAKEHIRLASLVYLGNMISHFIGFGYGHQAFALRGRSEALESLHLTPDKVPRYMISTYEHLKSVEALLQQTS